MIKLPRRQERFVIALLETNTITEACLLIGITTATGHKYLNDPEFKKYYMKLRQDTLQLATNKLQKAAVQAVEVLNEIMLDETASASSRVQSAKEILDKAYKSLEQETIVQRIDEMEQLINEERAELNDTNP